MQLARRSVGARRALCSAGNELAKMRAARDRRNAWVPQLPPRSDEIKLEGWTWKSEHTCDENYLDLCCLISMSSNSSGRVGSVIVDGITDGSAVGGEQGRVLVRGVNAPLYKIDASDARAVANAVAESAGRGLAIGGATCYVSKPPCPNCFSLLCVAGVAAIVTPYAMEPKLVSRAELFGIDARVISWTPERRQRMVDIGNATRDWDAVKSRREERKKRKEADRIRDAEWEEQDEWRERLRAEERANGEPTSR